MHSVPSFSGAAARRLFTAAVLFFLSCTAPAAVAQTWLPDPAYNGGLLGPDAFAGSFANSHFGQRLVLDDGEIIAAGVVPALSGNLGAIGLVRYDASGTRVPWSNPGSNGHYGNQYVVLPNGTFNRVTGVRDLALFGSRLFVLVETERYTLGNPLTNPGTHFDGYGVDVVVFGTDGSFKAASEVDFDDADLDNRTAWGSGIALYDNGQFPTTVTLMYAGRKKIDNVERPAVRRFTVAGSGALTAAYAMQHPTFGSECSPTTHCSVFGIALGGRTTFNSPPRIYLVGSRYSTCTGICYDGWQTIVMRVDSNAQPVNAFSNNGINFVQHGRGSRGRAIAVDGSIGALGGDDLIYVASEVDLDCAMGVAVAKYGQDGIAVVGFGNTFGGTQYGGSNAVAQACSLQHQLGTARDSFATSIARNGDRIAVAGYAVGGPGVLCPIGQPCPEDRFDGEIGVIDADSGSVLSHQRYPYRATPNGERERHGAFYDIAAGDNDSFSVVGDVRYPGSHADPALRGKTQFATLRVVPSAHLFGDGFE